MKLSLLEKLCCPFDKGDLDLKIFTQNEKKHVLEGLMTCTTCKRYYPIIYGVPIMTPDEYRQQELEQPHVKKWLPTVDSDGFMLT